MGRPPLHPSGRVNVLSTRPLAPSSRARRRQPSRTARPTIDRSRWRLCPCGRAPQAVGEVAQPCTPAPDRQSQESRSPLRIARPAQGSRCISAGKGHWQLCGDREHEDPDSEQKCSGQDEHRDGQDCPRVPGSDIAGRAPAVNEHGGAVRTPSRHRSSHLHRLPDARAAHRQVWAR